MSSTQKFKDILNSPVTINIFKILSSKKNSMTFSQFLEKLSENIDKEIIKKLQKDNLEPLEGSITIGIDKESLGIKASWEFYFKNPQDDSITKINSDKTFEKSILKSDDYQNIKEESKTYTINPPKLDKEQLP